MAAVLGLLLMVIGFILVMISDKDNGLHKTGVTLIGIGLAFGFILSLGNEYH